MANFSTPSANTGARVRTPLVLPQELADIITDYCRIPGTSSSAGDRDLPSLLACSLVSRSWLTAARRHIFHTLRIAGDPHKATHTLTEDDEINYYGLNVVDEHCYKADRFVRFAAFLAAAPYVCRHVRELRLYSKRPSGRDSFSLLFMGDLLGILGRLPRLRTLELRRIRLALDYPSWHPYAHSDINEAMKTTQLPYMVERMHIADIQIHGRAWDALGPLTAACSKDLLIGPFNAADIENPNLPTSPTLTLRSLTLSGVSTSQQNFARCAVLSTETLRCVIDALNGNTGMLGTFIQQVSSKLARFEFEIKSSMLELGGHPGGSS